jgi:hypothetical protein
MDTIERIIVIPGPKLAEGWATFRKLPVEVKAKQYDVPFEVETLEGTMRGNPGDYCIQGVEGEVYPCKREIFEATYEAV